MKKITLLVLILFPFIAKSQVDEKKVLNTIEYALAAFDMYSFNEFNSEYIVVDNTVMGKRYLSLGTNYKYNEVILNKVDGQIKSATYIMNKDYKREIGLVFNENNVERVISDGYFDFNFKYDEDGLRIFAKDGRADIVYSMSFDGEKIKTIVKAIRKNETSKPYIDKIIKVKYEGNDVIKTFTSYKQDKETIDKNILQKYINKYTRIDSNTYSNEYLDNGIANDLANGKKTVYTFDNLDRLTSSIQTNKQGKSIHQYTYQENSMNVLKKLVESDFTNEKMTFIDIFEDLPNTSEMKDYEWKKGEYRLDEHKDLIFEKRDGKLRKKVDGVWSDWKASL